MAVQNTTQDHPVVAATRARQGRWGKHVLWVLIVSLPGEMARALLLGAGWAINLMLAEWWISRQGRRKKVQVAAA